jgi:hypothetical protein
MERRGGRKIKKGLTMKMGQRERSRRPRRSMGLRNGSLSLGVMVMPSKLRIKKVKVTLLPAKLKKTDWGGG